MSTWPQRELARIADAQDLHVAPLREDGSSFATPIRIWSVVVDGDLYVRAYYGQKSRWFQAAVRHKAGRISAAGTTTEVRFQPVGGAIDDQIDDAYRRKYGRSSYLAPMISANARAATLRITPKD